MESLRGNVPFLGQLHHGTSIKHTKPKEMVELQTNTVALPLVVLVIELVLVGGQYC